MWYSITGDEAALEFFAIDLETGVVVLRKSLVDVPTTRYTVSIHEYRDVVNEIWNRGLLGW